MGLDKAHVLVGEVISRRKMWTWIVMGEERIKDIILASEVFVKIHTLLRDLSISRERDRRQAITNLSPGFAETMPLEGEAVKEHEDAGGMLIPSQGDMGVREPPTSHPKDMSMFATSKNDTHPEGVWVMSRNSGIEDEGRRSHDHPRPDQTKVQNPSLHNKLGGGALTRGDTPTERHLSGLMEPEAATGHGPQPLGDTRHGPCIQGIDKQRPAGKPPHQQTPWVRGPMVIAQHMVTWCWNQRARNVLERRQGISRESNLETWSPIHRNKK